MLRDVHRLLQHFVRADGAALPLRYQCHRDQPIELDLLADSTQLAEGDAFVEIAPCSVQIIPFTPQLAQPDVCQARDREALSISARPQLQHLPIRALRLIELALNLLQGGEVV